ncbi:MAG: hypothetical protein KAI47_18150, partial [Deltaproteobacteria bacterium]|nr:hypothetical protein [Deltaproteobacteria bacterium]
GGGLSERVGGATGPELSGEIEPDPQSDTGGGEKSWDGPTLDGLAREAVNYEAQPSDMTSREADDGDEDTLSGALQLFDQGTFEGALWICERMLSVDPENLEAQELLERIQTVLVHQYERDLGDLSRVPITQVPMQEIVWHKLDHRAGFLLSRVDSMLSFDDILDISGMSRFEALRILAQLIEQGVIGVAS